VESDLRATEPFCKNVARLKSGQRILSQYVLKLSTQSSIEGDNKMETATVENGKGTAAKLAHLTAKAAEGKMLAEDLVEIGKRKAQRMVRKGYEAGEDYLDESKRYIKHNPWQSVGVALGVGLVLGFLGGFLSRRR
jgi:ElaB/YqjD/DUF883 family membrane-anchored ribosome-binding protein